MLEPKTGKSTLSADLQVKTELKETFFDRLLLLISSIAFCTVLVFVFLQVIIRYITVHVGFSLPWTEEAARYVMITFTFLGSALACLKKEHIVITSLVDYLPPKARIYQEMVSILLILLFLVVAIKGTYSYTLKMMVAPVGAISWLRVGHIYGAMSVSLVLMAIYQIRWLIYYIGVIIRNPVGRDVNTLE